MEENVDVFASVIDGLNKCDMWFTTKQDPTPQEPGDYYKLDEYGCPTDVTIKKITKEVNSLIGDGAVDIYDAIDLWISDALVDCRIDYKDNLVTKFADKPVVDNIEAYENPVQFPGSKKVEGRKLQEHTESVLKKYNSDSHWIKPFVDLFKTSYPDKNVDAVYLEIIEGGWQPCVAFVESSGNIYRVYVASLNDGMYMSDKDSVKLAGNDFKKDYDYVEESKKVESKYVVEYRLSDTGEVIRSKEFDNFVDAMKYQGNIVKKMKDKIDYCEYKNLEENKSKKTEYYKMPDDEHIIWDSEVDYYDEDYMADVKANQYQDYLDDFEPSEPLSYEDWLDSEECYDNHYHWFEDSGIENEDWDELVELYDDYFREDYDEYVENYKDEPLDFESWYRNFISDSSYDDWNVLEEDLDENVLPEIDRQVNNDVLLLSGNYGSNYADFRPSGAGGVMWNNGVKGFKNYMGGFDRVCITTRNGMLGAICNDHDGTVSGQFYTLPEVTIDFIKKLGIYDELIEEIMDYHSWAENVSDITEQDILDEFNDYIKYDNLDARLLNQHIDLLVPIKDTISAYTKTNESVDRNVVDGDKSVNFKLCTKDKVDENYQKRLDEVNNKSKGLIDDMVSKEDFDETSAYGRIVMRTANMFDVLSKNGYDVDVTFDNGESTSAIQLGPQGGKIMITITDADRPLRAFTSGNFELADENFKTLEDIQKIIDTL